MPFDGVGFPIDDRVSKIDQVIDLLATPNQWCKAQFKTRDGRYCIRGAMTAVEGADFLKPIMLQAIREVTGERYLRIESFNDHPHTQHAQVLRVLIRARQLVVSRWAPDTTAAPARAGWSALLQQALRGTIRVTACMLAHSRAQRRDSIAPAAMPARQAFRASPAELG